MYQSKKSLLTSLAQYDLLVFLGLLCGERINIVWSRVVTVVKRKGVFLLYVA
jgi:hypothetical protein